MRSARLRESIGSTTGGAGGPSSGMVGSLSTGPAGDQTMTLPTQQQRVLAQLKTAMLGLNKKHGAATTNEILNQIIQSISTSDDSSGDKSTKPEYSDVTVDSELSVPPLPDAASPSAVGAAKRMSTPPAIRSVPRWFSFDIVSEPELVYFGPLFSMDEERWKIYLSLRNDIVRIYEDMLGIAADKFNVYLSSSELRSKLHPKDDAAYVFEMWRFLTDTGVINRGRKDELALKTATGCGMKIGGERPVLPTRVGEDSVTSLSTHTKINCSSCGRECRFVCYKPLPVPPESPVEQVDGEEVGVKDGGDKMVVDEGQAAKEEDGPVGAAEVEQYMCHDCTPAYFEKIPLRLFVDDELRQSVIRGEFEEITKDDLKHFLSVPSAKDEGDVLGSAQAKASAAEELRRIRDAIMGKVGKKSSGKNSVVSGWSGYSGLVGAAVNGANGGPSNPLEILDATMQEALMGAGQKIRGSVVIEQQVRNMVFGNTQFRTEEPEPVCPVSIGRALELVVEVLKRVAAMADTGVPSEVMESPVMQLAKKTDPVHVELLITVAKISIVAHELRQELLKRACDFDNVRRIVRERVAVKTEYVGYLSKLASANTNGAVGSVGTKAAGVADLFKTVKIDSSTHLASRDPRQLRLASI